MGLTLCTHRLAVHASHLLSLLAAGSPLAERLCCLDLRLLGNHPFSLCSTALAQALSGSLQAAGEPGDLGFAS